MAEVVDILDPIFQDCKKSMSNGRLDDATSTDPTGKRQATT
jgi:hypothetical protein